MLRLTIVKIVKSYWQCWECWFGFWCKHIIVLYKISFPKIRLFILPILHWQVWRVHGFNTHYIYNHKIWSQRLTEIFDVNICCCCSPSIKNLGLLICENIRISISVILIHLTSISWASHLTGPRKVPELSLQLILFCLSSGLCLLCLGYVASEGHHVVDCSTKKDGGTRVYSLLQAGSWLQALNCTFSPAAVHCTALHCRTAATASPKRSAADSYQDDLDNHQHPSVSPSNWAMCVVIMLTSNIKYNICVGNPGTI